VSFSEFWHVKYGLSFPHFRQCKFQNSAFSSYIIHHHLPTCRVAPCPTAKPHKISYETREALKLTYQGRCFPIY
jgi:hypothetical protein